MVVNRRPHGSAAYRAARLTEACCSPSRAAEPRALRAGNPRLSRNRSDRVAVAAIWPPGRRSGIFHMPCARPLSGRLRACEGHGLEHPLAAKCRLRIVLARLSFAHLLFGMILFVHIINLSQAVLQRLYRVSAPQGRVVNVG